MRHRVLATVFAFLVLAAPAWAQSRPNPPAPYPIPPPNAGTQTVCCSGWTVTAHYGWPPEFPDMWPPDVPVAGVPLSWPVVTITARPSAPTGNTYAVLRPGDVAQMIAWNPALGTVKVGRELYRLGAVTPIVGRVFSTTSVNALGGQFPGQGILMVVHAGHLGDTTGVAIQSSETGRWWSYTVRRSDIR